MNTHVTKGPGFRTVRGHPESHRLAKRTLSASIDDTTLNFSPMASPESGFSNAVWGPGDAQDRKLAGYHPPLRWRKNRIRPKAHSQSDVHEGLLLGQSGRLQWSGSRLPMSASRNNSPTGAIGHKQTLKLTTELAGLRIRLANIIG